MADSSLAKQVLGWVPRYDDLGVIVETALSWERRLAQVAEPDIKDLRRRLASGF